MSFLEYELEITILSATDLDALEQGTSNITQHDVQHVLQYVLQLCKMAFGNLEIVSLKRTRSEKKDTKKLADGNWLVGCGRWQVAGGR